jgi:hypothetical protein
MPEAERSNSPSFVDERGTLIATELSDVPFAVKRVFVVRGPEGGAVRGNHTVNGCQLIMLLSGAVTMDIGASVERLDHTVTLTEVGSRILLPDGTYIRYVLPDERSSILVLCERSFEART